MRTILLYTLVLIVCIGGIGNQGPPTSFRIETDFITAARKLDRLRALFANIVGGQTALPY